MNKLNCNHSSSTDWENSFYGGYTRLLYDLPEVKLDTYCQIEISAISKLGYFLGHKLIRLFILRIYEYNLLDYFIINSRIKVINEERFLLIDKDALQSTFTNLLVCEQELKSLFGYYKEEIVDSIILMRITNNFRSPLESIKKTVETIVANYQRLIGDRYNKEPIKIRLDNKQETEFRLNVEYASEFDLDKITEDNDLEYSSNDKKEQSKKVQIADVGKGKNKAVTFASDIKQPVFIPIVNGRKTVYNNSDLMEIRRIVDRLDISFEPDSDELKSLRQGKIDTNKLAEVLAFNDRIYSRVVENQKTKPFKVILLCDESGSMFENLKYKKQYNLVKLLFGAFSHILPLQDISVYGHSGREYPEIYIYHDVYNPSFDYTIDHMLRTQRLSNYDGMVIEAIYNRTRIITDEPILMIIISDGEPAGYGYGGKSDIDDMVRMIEKCKRDKFVIMGIGFEFDGVQDLYYYHTIINDMNKLAESTTNLLNSVVKAEFK
jgi:hypothetical protein